MRAFLILEISKKKIGQLSAQKMNVTFSNTPKKEYRDIIKTRMSRNLFLGT